MKKFVAVIGAALILAGGGWPRKRVTTIYAQSLPITKTVVWDPNPATDQVTLYTVTLDGTTIGTPTTPSQQFTVTTAGAHTLTVSATNLWGTSPATALAINVKLPDKPTNPKIQ